MPGMQPAHIWVLLIICSGCLRPATSLRWPLYQSSRGLKQQQPHQDDELATIHQVRACVAINYN